MGKQVNFFIGQSDAALIQKWAEIQGAKVMKRYQSTKGNFVPKIEQTSKLVTYYFLPKNISLDALNYVPLINIPGEMGLSISKSPVIEFLVCPILENSIEHPGRLYFSFPKGDKNYSATNKLYESLSRKIKKWEKTTLHGYYVGPNTAELVQSKTLELNFGKITYELS